MNVAYQICHFFFFFLSTGHIILTREQAECSYMAWVRKRPVLYSTQKLAVVQLFLNILIISEDVSPTVLKNICDSIWLASAGVGGAHPHLSLVLYGPPKQWLFITAIFVVALIKMRTNTPAGNYVLKNCVDGRANFKGWSWRKMELLMPIEMI